VARFPEIGSLAHEWSALADRVQAHPWTRPDWLRAWWEAFGRGRLEVLTTRHENRLTGVLPIAWRDGAIRSPTNWHTIDFGMLAEDGQAQAELSGQVFARRPRSLSFAFMSPDRSGAGDLQATARKQGYSLAPPRVELSPYVPLEGGHDAYLQTGRPSKALLRELRRHRRRLEELGDVSFMVERGGEGLQALLDQGFAIEASGWKGRNGTAITSTPQTLRYYTEVAHLAARSDNLRLFFLRLDGRPLAFSMAFEANGVLYAVKAGYDESYKKYAPGQLLRYQAIDWAVEHGVQRYVLGAGGEPHKADWSSTNEHLVRLVAFAPTLAGRAERAAFVHGRPLARRALRRYKRLKISAARTQAAGRRASGE
jgi:CelD/BcsL family acetyltransferase involved in cellulose biosynthesis